MIGPHDSPRWCATCNAHGDHHTDRHPKPGPPFSCGLWPYPGDNGIDTEKYNAAFHVKRGCCVNYLRAALATGATTTGPADGGREG